MRLVVGSLIALTILVWAPVRADANCDCESSAHPCCVCQTHWFVGRFCSFVHPGQTGHCSCIDGDNDCNESGVQCGSIQPSAASTLSVDQASASETYTTCSPKGALANETITVELVR